VSLFRLTLLSLICASAQAVENPELPIVRAKAKHEDSDRRREAVNPLRVIGREEIDKTNDLTVIEFLRRQSGMSFSGPPGNLKDIRMRGLDKGYTQILIDGEPWLGSTKDRQVQLDQLPMSMVERVEIIRSPLADQGGEGVGGTINLVLRRASGPELSLRASAGWQDSELGGKGQGALQFNHAGRSGTWAWVLPLNLTQRHELKTKTKRAESFQPATSSGAREAEDNQVREWNGGPRLSWQPNEQDTLSANLFFNRNQGDKHKEVANLRLNGGTQTAQGGTVEDEAKHRETLLAGLRWQRLHAAGLQTTVGLSAQRGSEDKLKPKRDFNAAGATTKTELEDATVRGRSLRGFGDLAWQADAEHRLAAGLAWRHETRKDFKLKDGKPLPADQFDLEERQTSLYLRHDWQLQPAHALVWGLRQEWRQTTSRDAAGLARQGRSDALQPSAAWRWRLAKDSALRLAAARTQRVAKFDQLSTAVRGGSGTVLSPYQAGNPALQPEMAEGLDLALERDFWGGAGYLGLNASQRWVDNAVENRVAQETDGRFYSRPVNVPGTSCTRALELDGRFDLRALGLKQLSLLGNYSRFKSRKAGSSDPLGDQPRYVANLGFDWRSPKQGLQFGARYNQLGRVIKAGGEWESTQRLLDLHAQWQIHPRWALRLAAANLLDTEKQKHKPKFNAAGQLTQLDLESERGGRSVLFTLETQL